MTGEAWGIVAVVAGIAWFATLLAFMGGCRFGREQLIRQLADEFHQELEELP